MQLRYYKAALLLGTAVILPTNAQAQAPSGTLPPVDVIQQQPPKPKPAPRAAAPRPKPQPAPVAAPPPVEDFVEAPGGPLRNENGRVVENAPTLSPVNPSSIVPTDLGDFSGAGSVISKQKLESGRPLENHEALLKVPGVIVINDDGLARHSGIGVRGAPVRRSRKVLILEDGDSINFSAYIDPSTHYTPPLERIENIQVIRGTSIVHGPLSNHGVINFQNLSPFGAPETVISGTIGSTEDAKTDLNYTRHIHHRDQYDNVGVVVSYSAGDYSGAWDNERLRYDDFYAAIGWKGREQDLTLSGVYFRQRDRYDEANFLPEEFEQFGRKKSQADPVSVNNNFNSDIYRLQALHNYYVDADTTVSSRIYGFYNDRPRFEAEEDNQGGVDGFVMEGRNRQYAHVGAESRIEMANRAFIGGLKQDIQAGVRYEFHRFRDSNTEGEFNEKLDIDNRGETSELLEKYEADAFSAFVQTAIHLRSDFTVTPGVRFEIYDVTRDVFLNDDRTDDDGDGTCDPGDGDLCGQTLPVKEKSDFNNVLPGISFAYTGIDKSTVYGGIHRGHTPHVGRGEFFPLKNEIGVNYQLGLRSQKLPGLTLDMAVFHNEIENYQVKEAFTDDQGRNVFGVVDEAEINGFEILARIDSNTFTGGPWNFFAEGVYTFSDSKITESADPAEEGNLLPEVPRQVANLTLGVQHKSGWDASLTWTYRGNFFTDTANSNAFQCEAENLVTGDEEIVACGTPGFEDEEVVGGKVDDVWLLSARINYTIPGSGTTLFVSGQNLEDKLYVTDLADGIKPGQGRTVMGGFKYKFD